MTGLERGYIQVYTGDGKGKTTAALGLALRAYGRGYKTLILQFMKSKGYGEHESLKNFASDIEIRTLGKPFFIAHEGEIDKETLAQIKDEVAIFPPGNPPYELVEVVKEGLELARQEMLSGLWDIVVLDEINVCVYFDLIPVELVVSLLEDKPENVELVLTGRKAHPEIITRADLVTEMKEVKHYYQQNVLARPGIES